MQFPLLPVLADGSFQQQNTENTKAGFKHVYSALISVSHVARESFSFYWNARIWQVQEGLTGR